MGYAEFRKRYVKILRLANNYTEPELLFAIALIATVLSALLSLVSHSVFPLLIGLVVADLVVYFPYSRGLAVLDDVDKNLPDALKQIAATLKSGGTFEMALQEIVTSDYGAVSRQFRYVLEDLRSGHPIDVALTNLAQRVPSDLIKRVVTIIVDAFHAGGGIADVLFDVADDARETNRLMEERKAKTTMQGLFIIMASVVLAPFIIGATMGIMQFFTIMGNQFAEGGMLTREELLPILQNIAHVTSLLTFYVLFQAAMSSIMLATIREGKPANGIKYMPFFMLAAYAIMYGSSVAVGGLMAGG